jgi:predicted dehydrogenase
LESIMSELPVLRWGILGTGNIAGKFATDLRKLRERVKLVAVGSRSRDAANAFRDRHAAERAYGSYDELVAADDIDAIYISLPNHLHRDWSVRCSASGKHVLCEKPAGMTVVDVDAMVDAARKAGRFWMEAYAYRCHPRYARIAELMANGAIGEARLAHATFCFDGSSLGRPRLWDPQMGGGALMDVGVYPLSLLRLLARFAGHGEPDEVHASGRISEGVDHWSAGVLRFGGRFVATWQTAIACAAPSVASIHGELGQIEIRSPWKADEPTCILRRPGHEDEAIIVDDGEPLYGREALTLARFADRGQAPACTWEDSIQQARLLDVVRAQLGVRWAGEG